MKKIEELSVFVSIDGRSFGMGDPEHPNPMNAEFCLLCGVTDQQITLDVWRKMLRDTDDEGKPLEVACERMIEQYGGRVILKPSRIHRIEKNENGFNYVVRPFDGEYEA